MALQRAFDLPGIPEAIVCQAGTKADVQGVQRALSAADYRSVELRRVEWHLSGYSAIGITA